jgi:hypothetical protein
LERAFEALKKGLHDGKLNARSKYLDVNETSFKRYLKRMGLPVVFNFLTLASGEEFEGEFIMGARLKSKNAPAELTLLQRYLDWVCRCVGPMSQVYPSHKDKLSLGQLDDHVRFYSRHCGIAVKSLSTMAPDEIKATFEHINHKFAHDISLDKNMKGEYFVSGLYLMSYSATIATTYLVRLFCQVPTADQHLSTHLMVDPQGQVNISEFYEQCKADFLLLYGDILKSWEMVCDKKEWYHIIQRARGRSPIVCELVMNDDDELMIQGLSMTPSTHYTPPPTEPVQPALHAWHRLILPSDTTTTTATTATAAAAAATTAEEDGPDDAPAVGQAPKAHRAPKTTRAPHPNPPTVRQSTSTTPTPHPRPPPTTAAAAPKKSGTAQFSMAGQAAPSIRVGPPALPTPPMHGKPTKKARPASSQPSPSPNSTSTRKHAGDELASPAPQRSRTYHRDDGDACSYEGTDSDMGRDEYMSASEVGQQ